MGTSQTKVAKILGVSEDTITYWENNRALPQIHSYPKIIEFLGYNPFLSDGSTFGGKIYKYRIENGLSQQALGKLLNVDESTIFNWEKNIHFPIGSKREVLKKLII